MEVRELYLTKFCAQETCRLAEFLCEDTDTETDVHAKPKGSLPKSKQRYGLPNQWMHACGKHAKESSQTRRGHALICRLVSGVPI